MGERRRAVTDLDRSLARHRRREARTAVALLELERHPAYRLLDTGGAAGHTARRWQSVRPVRDALWRDFARWSALLGDAERVRARRRRPSASDVADLGRVLGSADRLVPPVRAALADLRAFVHACASTAAAVAAVLAPVGERLAGARRAVVDLDLRSDDPDAVAARTLGTSAAARERDAAADPLAFTGSRRDVADLERPVDALVVRLDPLIRLRAGWDDHVAALTADVDDVRAHRARTARTVARARAELRDTVPAMPPDRTARLRELLDTVLAADGWRARHDAVVALREAVADARAELDGTGALVAGLLERRDDLRGRFGAYRARSGRLGHGDDPELAELAGRIATRLWAVPAELARATRDLAAYRRRLAALGAS